MIKRKTWEEFRFSGLLWWINMILHTFGWAIVFETNTETGKVVDVYPARVKFRGFNDEENNTGYIKVSEYMVKNAHELKKEVKEI